MGSNAGQDASSTVQGAGAGFAVGGPWGAAVGGVIGLAGGIMSGNKESGYEQQQKAALAADQAKRDAFAAQQAQVYQPIETQMAHEAASPLPMNYGANLGAINTQAQQSQQRLGGQMAKMGMVGSGAQAAGQQGIEMGRVGELSSAFNTGLQARNKLGMDLLQHYNPLGNTQLDVGALTSSMNFGAGQQALANQGMQQGFGAFGKGLAGVLNGGLKLPGGTTNDGTNGTAENGVDMNSPYVQENNMAAAAGVPEQYSALPLQGFGGNPGMGSTGTPSGGSEFPAGWDISQTGGGVPAETGTPPTDMGGGLNLWDSFAVAGD